MKAALITEEQIKAIEDVLGELTAIVGSEQEYKQLNALAIVKSLKVQEPQYYALTLKHTWLSISEKDYELVQPKYRMMVYAGEQP